MLSGLCLRGLSEIHKSLHKSELLREEVVAQAQPHRGEEASGIMALASISPPLRS